MAVYGEDEIIYPIDDKNQTVYIPVSSLKNQNYQAEVEDTEEFLNKFILNRPQKSSKELISYYCAVCGRNVLLLNAKLHRLPTRRTDGSIIIDRSKYFLKHYLKMDEKALVIVRDKHTADEGSHHGQHGETEHKGKSGKEELGSNASSSEEQADIIMELKCECGVPVAYTSLMGLENCRQAANNTNTRGMDGQEKKVIFVLSDGIVLDPKLSLVFAHLAGHIGQATEETQAP